MSSSAPTPTKITDDKIYTEGDCTIISSDNVRFKVESFWLLASSAFVRGMLKACPTQPFDFPMSDPEIETSEAIRLWLGKACNPSSNAVSTLRQEYLLMHLARKYLCDPMIDDIKRRLFSRVERSAITYEDYFIFAATFDDAAMAAKVVRAPKVTGKANAKIAAIHRAAGLSPGKSATNGVSNPLGWSGRTRRETPMDYFWALAYVFMDSNFIEITGDAFLMALQKERKEIREEGKVNTSGKRKRDAIQVD